MLTLMKSEEVQVAVVLVASGRFNSTAVTETLLFAISKKKQLFNTDKPC